MIALREISRCFEGEIPSLIATCSLAGEPNVAHLSTVRLVDDEHVATSNQFFTTTSANLDENPLATLLCPDPLTVVTYKLLARRERSESSGALFDEVRSSIEAIAALTGMSDVFELRSIDVFRVLDVSLVPSRGTALLS